MSDIHNAAVDLERAIARIENPSVAEFQQLDFQFETSIENASFAVRENTVVLRFGSDSTVGYATPINNSDGAPSLEKLEEFLSVAERIKEYQVVSKGVVNREILEGLKSNLPSDFVMILNGKVSDITLTSITIFQDSPNVKIFYNMLLPRTQRIVPVFDNLNKLEPDSDLTLYLKPV